MDSVLTCLVSDDVGPGALAESLAAEIASYVGADTGVCLRDYALAIELALTALDLPSGSGVIISPLAPDVYGAVLDKLGITALYPDVDPVTGTMKSDAVARLASGGAGAVILHYTMGVIPDVEQIGGLGLPVIEDISQGIGGITADRRIGAYGRFTVLSMEPNQLITTGGGAAVFPGSRADRAALRRVVDDIPRERIMPNMNAALGLQQMKRLESFIEKRKEIAGVFHRALLRGRHKMLSQPGEAENVFFSFPVVLAGGAREVIQYCSRKQVEVVHAFDNSLLGKEMRRSNAVAPVSGHASGEEPVAAEGETHRAGLPGANALLLRCVLFPLYPALPRRDVERLEKILTTLP